MRWILRMAWRELRAQRLHLALYLGAVVLGVAALTGITGFRDRLASALEERSRSLLGADLEFRSRSDFPAEADAAIAALSPRRASELRLRTMIYFPRVSGTRLVQVRGIDPGFPFYGSLETDPPEAATRLYVTNAILVDEVVMLRFGLHPGDEARLGSLSLRIAGALRRLPGEVPAESFVAPRVLVSRQVLEAGGLLQPGSVFSRRTYVRLEDPARAPEWAAALKNRLATWDVEVETAEQRRQDLVGRSDRFGSYLSLVGFLALLLAGVGLAGGLQVYVRRQRVAAAILRCLGATPSQVMGIHLVQVVALVLAGTVIGAALGRLLQEGIGTLARDLLPVQVTAGFTLLPFLRDLAWCMGLGLLFATLPLLPLRRVAPLAALRRDAEGPALRFDLAQLATLLALGLAVLAYAMRQTGSWTQGSLLGLGVAGVLLATAGVGVALRALLRRLVRPSWPFALRQSLANLYRPGNQTVGLLVSLGFGICLLFTLHLAEATVRGKLSVNRNTQQPNLVLIDVQPDQREGMDRLALAQGLPVLHRTPIVNMRLAAVRGVSARALRQDPAHPVPDWALQREYRSTYRNQLAATETIQRGHWHGDDPGPRAIVPVSIEAGLAKTLRVDLGDRMLMDVQGQPLSAVITSLREVDWSSMQPNFFLVFPEGVLESAPQTLAYFTRTADAAGRARAQAAVAEAYPNVTGIDIALLLDTVNDLVGRIGQVTRFLAGFTLLAGLLVLAGALRSSQEQRRGEAVLLRTLGAGRRQLMAIAVGEFLLLGLLAACAGLGLASLAGWLLARYLFEAPLIFSVGALLGHGGALILGTLFMAWLGSRSAAREQPLAALRRLQG